MVSSSFDLLARRSGLILMTFLLASSVALSQTEQARFGIRAGYNLNVAPVAISALGFDVNYFSKYNHGFYIGANYLFVDSDKFDLKAELNYNKRGSKLAIEGLIRETDLNMHYLDVALAGRTQVLSHLSAVVGIYAGYQISITERRLGEFRENPAEAWDSYDLGSFFGGELRISDHLLFEGRFYIGLVRIQKEMTTIDEGHIESYMNRQTSLGLSYVF